MLWDNTPGSLGCPPVPTQDGALSRWSPTLSKRPNLMRRGTLKGPIPIKMSLCLLQLSALSSGALHTPRSLLQPSTASVTADTLLGRLTCPLPTLNGVLSGWSSALSKRSVLMRFEHDAGETTGNQDGNWASAGPGVPWGCLLKILVASCGLAHQ